MLQVPRLDDLDYNKIFGRARGRISQYTEEWTDLNHHDPGITTLQAMAWLSDMLNFYADSTDEEHRLKYLKLLGIEPECSPATCVVALQSEEERISLPPGTRIAADGVVFELRDGYDAASNRVEAVCQELDGYIADLTPFAGKGGFARIFTYDAERPATVYLGFRGPLGEKARLHVDVAETGGRAPFLPGEAPELVSLAWEYYNGTSWRPAALLEDGTGGFLTAGFVGLGLPGGTAVLGGHPLLTPLHYLRIRIAGGGYDVLPEIGSVEANCAVAEQVRTVARTFALEWNGEERLPIGCLVRDTDLVMVSAEQGGGYEVWYRFTQTESSLCSVVEGDAPWKREIVFGAAQKRPGPGLRLLVTILDGGSYNKLTLGKTNGCAGMRLPVDSEHVWGLRLALFDAAEDGPARFEIWEPCADISALDCGARAFAYDRADGSVVFGDSLAGLQPKAGKLVMALDWTESLLGEGNALAGQVNRLLDPAGKAVTAVNITAAANGRSPLASRELEARIPEKLANSARAVTPEDYERLVKETPGLLIDLVGVVSHRDYNRSYGTNSSPNTVYVAVKPGSSRMARPALTDAYRSVIRRRLEQFRLLTTNIEVIPARYAGITVSGRIALRENAAWAVRAIEELLSGLIDFKETGRFADTIVCSYLHSRLEMLEGVAAVAELALSYTGGCCEKNSHGDVVLYGDGLAWLEKISIEYS